MKLNKFYERLASIVGGVIAQIICFLTLCVIMGALFRVYAWIDGSVSGGIDPLYFAMAVAISACVFLAWRMFASADLDG